MATRNNSESAWMGWVGFAAVMLALVGVFHIIEGFVALFKNDIYAVTANGVWLFDYTQWGWIHIFGGLLAFFAAASLAQGKMFGRIVAVLVAMVSVVANMAFVPVYPVWSLMMVTIGVLVIWAVMVHGGELKED